MAQFTNRSWFRQRQHAAKCSKLPELPLDGHPAAKFAICPIPTGQCLYALFGALYLLIRHVIQRILLLKAISDLEAMSQL